MIYTKEHKDFPNVGRFCAIRFTGSKGWLEPFGSIDSFIDDPQYEVVKYDTPGEKLPD
jgi:hypothetical protein